VHAFRGRRRIVPREQKLADVSVVGSSGWEVMLALGATVSTCHEAESEPVLPAPSVALTSKVCEPSSRPE